MRNLLSTLGSLILIGGAFLLTPTPAEAKPTCQDGFCQSICNGTDGYCVYSDCGSGTEMCLGARGW